MDFYLSLWHAFAKEIRSDFFDNNGKTVGFGCGEMIESENHADPLVDSKCSVVTFLWIRRSLRTFDYHVSYDN